MGITAYAAEKLGDIVFVDLPKAGSTVAEGAVVGEIESTKSVGELFAPLNGTVVEANDFYDHVHPWNPLATRWRPAGDPLVRPLDPDDVSARARAV